MINMANNQSGSEKSQERGNAVSNSPERAKGVADKKLREGAMNLFGQTSPAPEAAADATSEWTEKVSEQSSEQAGEEWSGKGSGTQQSTGGAQQTKGDDSTFIFDEKNLPPVDEAIRQIEAKLRKDIGGLELKARKYRGGLFTKPDYYNLNKVIKEIREKRILIQRLLGMAAEALKKLYISYFKPANTPVAK